ncbi:MAG: aminopeptidase [Bacteroidota bacterium]|nr:aminopeptidase [Bacteroidota bacterium]
MLRAIYILFFFFFIKNLSGQQHVVEASVEVDFQTKELLVRQKLLYTNTSNDTITELVLNDWNNAFSSKETSISKRFSDEFVRSYYYASDFELAKTTIQQCSASDEYKVECYRKLTNLDLLFIRLNKPLLPSQPIELDLQYTLKIPHAKFTGYGFSDNRFELKEWLLLPAEYTSQGFLLQSNENLQDITNARVYFNINLKNISEYNVLSNLKTRPESNDIILEGYAQNIDVIIGKELKHLEYKDSEKEVVTDLLDAKLDDFQKLVIIQKVSSFVNQKYGFTPSKILISNAAYQKNPFYGLNQLPSVLSPFPAEFIYELKFLKTYLETYLSDNLQIDHRNQGWISNAMAMYVLVQYVNHFYQELTMVGKYTKYGILKKYYAAELGFDAQLYYVYLFMARKNLDQATSTPKDKLIKFNEKIGARYKAGLDMNYLSNLIGSENIDKIFKEFILLNQQQFTTQNDFVQLFKKYNQSDLDIDYFFEQVVHSRKYIDYSLVHLKRDNDSIYLKIRNKAEVQVPIPLYSVKDKKLSLETWVEIPPQKDTILSFDKSIEQFVLNHNTIVPEYNKRNNYLYNRRLLQRFRPIKFTFYRDFEDARYNQVFYTPDFTYNLYNGFSPGVRLTNKSLIRRPLTLALNPVYSFKQNKIAGSVYLNYENIFREGNLYSVNYSFRVNHYNYTYDATYTRIIPSVLFRIREPFFRENKQQAVQARLVSVFREESEFTTSNNEQDYTIFNLRYINSLLEITKKFNFQLDFQLSNLFGKISSEVEFRRLYNKRQLNLRFFGSAFTHKATTSNYFDIATSRSTDYLFDYNYYGRSESSGFFSQQYITTEGGFKSRVTPFASQWLLSSNVSFNLWNWIEAYADLGMLKNKYHPIEFIYDSGIRLNFLTDYFEIYFPIYSNLGLEINESDYLERIRFVITIDPQSLGKLITRRWF